MNFGMRFVLFCFLAGVLVAAGCSGSVDSQSDAGQDDGGEVVPDGDPSPEEPANPDDDGDGEYDDGRDAVDGGDLDGDQPSDGPPAPSCTDNLWNQGEQWVDCGGPCAPCTTQETTVTIQARVAGGPDKDPPTPVNLSFSGSARRKVPPEKGISHFVTSQGIETTGIPPRLGPRQDRHSGEKTA